MKTNLKQLIKYIFLLFILLYLNACSPSITSWIQTPIHPQGNEDFTINIKATSRYKIKKVILSVYEFRYGTGALDNATLQLTPRSPIIKEFNNLNSLTVDLNHQITGTPNKTRIVFIVEVRNSYKSRTERASFDVGDPPEPFGFSTPGWPILLYNPSSKSSEKRIDLGLIPDKDYNDNFTLFLSDIEATIKNGYLENNAVRKDKKIWSFWTSTLEGDATKSTPDSILPEFIRTNAFFDGIGVVHSIGKRDFATQNVFTTEAINIGTALHETGHAVFKLRDEYCSSKRTSCSNCNIDHCNRLSSETECRDYNRANGFPEDDCRECSSDPARCWFPEPASLQCIMLNDNDQSLPSFQRTCIRRVKVIYDDFNDN